MAVPRQFPHASPKSGPHLVERAVDAMGGLKGLAPDAPFHVDAPSYAPLAPIAPVAPVGDVVPVPPEIPAGQPVVDMATLARAGLLVAPAIGRSRVSEEMQVVRGQVQRTMEAADADPPAGRPASHIVLVTSARPREGKSFVALNLAASLAVGGTRPVVLVDVDGRAGALGAALGLDGVAGLRDLADPSPRSPRGALVRTELERLLLLPYGTAPVDGPTVLSGAAVAAAVRRLAAALPGHVVVLDAPPCLSASDPSVLAGLAGQVLMVVLAERTQRPEVEAALDQVDACPTLQLVLNRVQLTASDTFGAYAHH